MHIEGRRIHIAGSADKNTPDYLLHYAHELVANLVRALSKEGATFIVGVGKEPLARPDDPSSPAIIFDWTLLKVAHKCLKDGVSLAQGPQGRLIAAVATSKLDQQIPESHQQIWKELREEKAVKLEFIEPGWTSGAIRRTRQAQLGDIRNYSVFRWSRATGPPGVSLPLWLSDSGSSGVWLDNNSASSLCQAFTTTQLRGWGKLLRCIKLAKRICANHGIEVKSYHLENMAVKAFEHYAGAKSDEDMLRHLFNQAKVLAVSRMKDITGQEGYIDRYLTSKTQRTMLAQQFAATEREIAKAEGNGKAWRKLLDLP